MPDRDCGAVRALCVEEVEQLVLGAGFQTVPCEALSLLLSEHGKRTCAPRILHRRDVFEAYASTPQLGSDRSTSRRKEAARPERQEIDGCRGQANQKKHEPGR